MKDPVLYSSLFHLLSHPSAKVRQRILTVLSSLDDSIIDELYPLLWKHLVECAQRDFSRCNGFGTLENAYFTALRKFVREDETSSEFFSFIESVFCYFILSESRGQVRFLQLLQQVFLKQRSSSFPLLDSFLQLAPFALSREKHVAELYVDILCSLIPRLQNSQLDCILHGLQESTVPITKLLISILSEIDRFKLSKSGSLNICKFIQQEIASSLEQVKS